MDIIALDPGLSGVPVPEVPDPVARYCPPGDTPHTVNPDSLVDDPVVAKVDVVVKAGEIDDRYVAFIGEGVTVDVRVQEMGGLEKNPETVGNFE
jgi:hypothetical protein